MMSSVAKVIQPTATVSSVPVSGPSEFDHWARNFQLSLTPWLTLFYLSYWNRSINITGSGVATRQFERDVRRLQRSDDYTSSQCTTFNHSTAATSEKRFRSVKLCSCSSSHPTQQADNQQRQRCNYERIAYLVSSIADRSVTSSSHSRSECQGRGRIRSWMELFISQAFKHKHINKQIVKAKPEA